VEQEEARMLQVGGRECFDEAKIRLLRGVGCVGRVPEFAKKEPLEVQVLTAM
jgi:hypothetical protein